MSQLPLIQRAYTLRLKGADPEDNSWREKLWKTHEAVNNGAGAFGDWLLTLRGGLDHELAGMNPPKKKKSPEKVPPDQIKDRCIILALSWLSVESEKGAPKKYIVKTDNKGRWETVETLREILKSRGIKNKEIESWIANCSDSLSAAIREDAVWVNRSRAFDDAVGTIGNSLTRDEIWDVLELFFGSKESYLKSLKIAGDEESDKTDEKEEVKDLVQKAGSWLSSRFGTGKGVDFDRRAEVYCKIAEWSDDIKQRKIPSLANLATALSEFSPTSKDLQGILGLISGPGYPSGTRTFLTRINGQATISKDDLGTLKKKAEDDANNSKSKVGGKGPRPWSDKILISVQKTCGFTYLQDGGSARHSEFAVMLDHAARRVSAGHTWIKRAESERRNFEDDFQKINNVPPDTKQWLDKFCDERSESSGAVEGYRVRKRAVGGWKDVIKAWSKKDCRTENDRIAAARALQDNPDIDKFGDIQLFEALAADDALNVWQIDGQPNPQPLLDYVTATDAEFKKRHFKVPAYCHPDPLLHPVFCDYGKSRWNISFSAHEGSKKNREALKKAEKALEKAKNENKGIKDKKRKNEAVHKLQKAKKELSWLKEQNGIKMDLFIGRTNTGGKIENTPLCWQSKLLEKDLSLKPMDNNEEGLEVSRASRLGRSAAGAGRKNPVNISAVFDQKDWNGRLQAPREELNQIARRVKKHGWDDEKTIFMKDNLKWFVTFSPRLQPQGPWVGYARERDLLKTKKDNNKEIVVIAPNKSKDSKDQWQGLAYPFWHSDNEKGRKGWAKHLLSRLSGLRVLSVDLGHRHAAACAVWETLPSEQVKKACKEAGCKKPAGDAMYLHLKHNGKTTIFRRIGPDKLDDKTHPAPWARLDRQFTIKLQGEEREVRMATAREIWLVHELEKDLGRSMPLIDRLVKAGWGATAKQKAMLDELKKKGWTPVKTQGETEDEEALIRRPSVSVNDLMFSAMTTARVVLRRHGDRARIGHYLITKEKTIPGGTAVKLDEEGRKNIITDALMLWHGLKTAPRWKDDAAETLWDKHIKTLLKDAILPDISEAGITSKERKSRKKNLEEKLKSVAGILLGDNACVKQISKVWCDRWKKDDEQWRQRLRVLRDWILPKGARNKDRTIRRVGGLSLDRLSTIKLLYQVQKAYFTRMHPKGRQTEGDKPVTAGEGFGQRILDDLENMRKQRVKQLASRIVEAALGVGRIKNSRKGKDPQHPVERVDEPCHAVVIENLTHYRPEETRTRRENRQLMTWSSSKVKEYLSEGCGLHGLHLREVPAGYTSRQDSRTGAPGIRCVDVPVKAFLGSKNNPSKRARQAVNNLIKDIKNKPEAWEEKLKKALELAQKGKSKIQDRYIVQLYDEWSKNADACKGSWVRFPQNGGDIFVSSKPCECCNDKKNKEISGLQADLNAAANIGLKALLDPDWSGSWWYVPCSTENFKPLAEKVKGSTVFQPGTVLKAKDESKEGKDKSKEIVNLWRDPSCKNLAEDEWQFTTEYWNKVQFRVVRRLIR